MRLAFTPKGTGIPLGGTLVSVRHQAVANKTDSERVRLSKKRIWFRIRNPTSNKRSLSKSSLRCLHLFKHWLSALSLSPMRSMFPKPVWPGFSAADACAMGTTMQMGGFIEDQQRYFWLSEQFIVNDFQQLGFPHAYRNSKGHYMLRNFSSDGFVVHFF